MQNLKLELGGRFERVAHAELAPGIGVQAGADRRSTQCLAARQGVDHIRPPFKDNREQHKARGHQCNRFQQGLDFHVLSRSGHGNTLRIAALGPASARGAKS